MKRGDKTWSLDLQFLVEHVRPILTRRVEEKVMGIMPQGMVEEGRDPKAVAIDIEKLKTIPEVLALGEATANMLNAATGFLYRLAEGTHPEVENIAKLSPFMQRVVKKPENFVHASITEKHAPDSTWHKCRHVFGRLALEYKLENVQGSKPGSFERSLRNNDLKDLKMYKSIAPDAMREAIKKLIKEACANHRDLAFRGEADAMITDGQIALAPSSSSSSTAVVPLLGLTSQKAAVSKITASKPATQNSTDDAADAKKLAMAKLFGSLAKFK